MMPVVACPVQLRPTWHTEPSQGSTLVCSGFLGDYRMTSYYDVNPIIFLVHTCGLQPHHIAIPWYARGRWIRGGQ